MPNPGDAPEEKLPPVDPGAETGDDPGEVPELPASEDDSDIDLDALEAGEEPPSEEEEGTVAGELTGKSIDSVIVDEDSKIMPGATEIVFTFKENPDAFRLLVTKTGKIKYFYRGLHNTLDSSVAPMPQDDAPEDTDDMSGMVPGALGDEGDDEDIEDMPPLGQEDMPPEEKEKEEEIP